ncbi:LytTR family DNA-binding domain-containing protein [Clostridium swellfunianum]|uniref:LytR/AlgR family response regulator transcription factor n=1 Tax=Clostridium swellfunianum TaxID=1367462 RepID=UPI00202E1210|nr:LytTR family DNA-binding domain-containing protein [Clostridium swellfunianum]MCM0647728.1 LytTR family DNA-binding domain-containing protein [Clostridium swellfunianum]
MIRIAICDDDDVILGCVCNKVKAATDKLKIEVDIKTFVDANMLLRDTNQGNELDILFLDIDMPKMSGFETAEIIRSFNKEVIIIFLTSMEELVYESFKYKPFRYIRKRKLDKELQEALSEAILAVQENSVMYQYIFKTEYGEVKFNIEDILYIECVNRKVFLKTKEEYYGIIGVQFSELVTEFINKDFVMLHRTCIVNLKCIFSIGKIDITLDTGQKLPMSRYKATEVKKAFTLFAR